MDHGPIEEQPEDERPRSPRPQGPDIEDPQSKASKAMTAVYAAGQDARDQKREAANAAGVKAALEVLAEKLNLSSPLVLTVGVKHLSLPLVSELVKFVSRHL